MKTYELLYLCLIISFTLSELPSDTLPEELSNDEVNPDNATSLDTSMENPIPINIREPTKVALVDFSDFITRKRDDFFESNMIAWLKRLAGPRGYGKMRMRVKVFNNGKLRFLEEEKTEVECELLRNDMDTIPYNCSIRSKIEIDSLEVDPSSIEIEGVNVGNFIISPYAEEKMDKLQEQDRPTYDKFEKGALHFGTLYYTNLTQNDKKFILKGNLDDSDFPSGKLILTLPMNNSEDKMNVTCDFTPNTKEGILNCDNPKYSVDTPLEGKVATNIKGDNLLTIAMQNPAIKLVYVSQYNLIPVNSNAPLIIVLAGISEYNHIRDYQAIFYIILKRISGRRGYGNIITFNSKINYKKADLNNNKKTNYNGGLRILDIEEQPTTCKKIKEDDDIDKLVFNCSVIIDEDKKIEAIEAIEETFKMEGLEKEVEIIESPHAKGQMKNIHLQTKSMGNIVSLWNGIITQNDNNFNISGNLDKDLDLSDKNITLTLMRAGTEDTQNSKCQFDKTDNTLICNYPKYPVNENLNGTVAFYENDKKTDCLLISMKEKQTNLKHSYNYFGGKKSSSGGLSGGAIAGIVIASVAALCAVVFSFILCKAPTKPPSSNVNTLEMVSSTNKINSPA